MKKFILIFSSVIIILDQVVKFLVTSNLEVYKSIKVIPNFFYITFVKNEGAAFSILQGGRWFFIILSFIALAVIIRYIFSDKNINKIDVISYSLIIGGIIGNLIDRVIYGYVVDFFDFYIFGYYNFPIFNIADMALIIGVFLMIYELFVGREKNEINNSRR